ncbi:MAG: Uma2 family endonuclease [Dehalococcoidia bacterium]|jgi:Uma2 family endonuclease
MVLKTRTSLAEFLALPETKPYLELMDGEVIEKPMPNYTHGTIVGLLMQLLRNYLDRTREARVVTEVRHLEDDEEWVFLPDVSVTRRERSGPPSESGPIAVVMPDLAIEVLSPDDRPGRLQRRIAHYMRSGVSILWVIDPQDEKLTVWRPGALPQDFAPPATVSASPVLESFELDLQQLFDALRD